MSTLNAMDELHARTVEAMEAWVATAWYVHNKDVFYKAKHLQALVDLVLALSPEIFSCSKVSFSKATAEQVAALSVEFATPAHEEFLQRCMDKAEVSTPADFTRPQAQAVIVAMAQLECGVPLSHPPS